MRRGMKLENLLFTVLVGAVMVAAVWIASAWPTRASIAILVLGSLGLVLAVWQFVLDARAELRKVFWPTRNETWITTALVFGFAAITGLFFWLLDTLLAWATKLLTGQGG